MARYVARDGTQLAFDAAGVGEPALVFVHGWSCDRSYFAPQFAHFVARRAVATLDLRGHGDSDHPEPRPGAYDIDTFADDVLEVAHAAGFDRPVVVGHSMGGLIALACAARPGAVRAAVMVDPGPIANQRAKSFLAEAADAVENDHDATLRTSFARNWFLPTDVARRDEIFAGVSKLPPNIAAASLRSMVDFDGITALQSVQVPLLSIGSAGPTDAPADLKDACPTITIGQTVGSGHFNQLEVPEQVNSMIDKFLAIHGL